MSNKYVITQNNKDDIFPFIYILSNSVDISDFVNRLDQPIISIGTVSFLPSKFGNTLEADVTHGCTSPTIPVDLTRAAIDKKIIEKFYL